MMCFSGAKKKELLELQMIDWMNWKPFHSVASLFYQIFLPISLLIHIFCIEITAETNIFVFSIGGAVKSFSAKLLPKESAIEYEGIFFNYQFETGEELNKLCNPVLTAAATKDPVSGNDKTLFFPDSK